MALRGTSASPILTESVGSAILRRLRKAGKFVQSDPYRNVARNSAEAQLASLCHPAASLRLSMNLRSHGPCKLIVWFAVEAIA